MRFSTPRNMNLVAVQLSFHKKHKSATYFVIFVFSIGQK